MEALASPLPVAVVSCVDLASDGGDQKSQGKPFRARSVVGPIIELFDVAWLIQAPSIIQVNSQAVLLAQLSFLGR